MTDYRGSAHSVYDIKYHLVWITKYRKSVLTGKIAERTREIIRNICKENGVEILAGHVSREAFMGQRVLCGEQWKCDGRSGLGIYQEPGVGRAKEER